MIGQAIEARRPIPKWTVFLLLVAIGMAILSPVMGSVHWAIAAVLPMLWGITLWLYRDPLLSGQFTEAGLELRNPPLTIPYEKLQGIWAKGRTGNLTPPSRRTFPMQVAHENGLLYIPANLNVSSEEVYQFLFSRFSPGGSRQVNPLLSRFLAAEEEGFGSERVWSFRARKYLAKPFSARKIRASGLAILLSAILWLSLAFSEFNQPIGLNKFDGWYAGGFIGFLIGITLFLASYIVTQTGTKRITRWQESSLVISPGGMAMVQGESKGEMRWDELLDVKWKSFKSQMMSDTGAPGIVLVFEGANVSIVDIYDRPLPIIYKHIAQCWREPPGAT